MLHHHCGEIEVGNVKFELVEIGLVFGKGLIVGIVVGKEGDCGISEFVGRSICMKPVGGDLKFW